MVATIFVSGNLFIAYPSNCFTLPLFQMILS